MSDSDQKIICREYLKTFTTRRDPTNPRFIMVPENPNKACETIPSCKLYLDNVESFVKETNIVTRWILVPNKEKEKSTQYPGFVTLSDSFIESQCTKEYETNSQKKDECIVHLKGIRSETPTDKQGIPNNVLGYIQNQAKKSVSLKKEPKQCLNDLN